MATVDEKMTAIAGAIRDKTGGTEPLTLDDMAIGVDEVYNKGGEEGYNSGIAEGKKAQYDEFWDTYQVNGTRTTYSGMFGWGWNDAIFNPKYCIKPTNGSSMFAFSDITKKITAEMFDGSLNTNYYRMFQQSDITEVEVLDLSSATNTGDIFRDSYCHTIDKLIFNTEGNTVIASDIFGNTSRLKNINSVEGLIAGYNLSFPKSPLTVESIKNIILALKDYAGTDSEYAYTLTLKSTTWTALDAEGATAPGGITWRDYITALGWNMA